MRSKYGTLRYHLDEAVSELRNAVAASDVLEPYFPDLIIALQAVARCAAAVEPEPEDEEE